MVALARRRAALPPASAAFAAAALLAVVLCASGASAARRYVPSTLHSTLSRSASNLGAIEWLTRRGREEEDSPVYILIKYEVPPALHDDFIERWDRHDKGLRDVRGLDFYQLTKDLRDNVFFWSYTEWDTFADLADHHDSKEHRDFHDWVDDNDVLTEAFPLEAVGDTKREYRFDREGEAAATASRKAAAADLERRRSCGGSIEDWDPREEPTHVAIKFHIQPSQVDKFLDGFEDVQDKVVEDEDENRFYVLRKFATLNHHFLVRGAWDSLDGWLDHLTSKHFIDLREFAKENDIEWYTEPFRVLYTSESKEEYQAAAAAAAA